MHDEGVASLPGVAAINSYVTMKTISATSARTA
jgi:hypothetical protein